MATDEQDAVTREWDAMAAEWDGVAASYRDAFVEVLWRECGLNRSGDLVVVDFGCGTGLLTERLRAEVGEVVAVDAAPKMIKALHDKIAARGWSNVRALTAVLAKPETHSEAVRDALSELKGKVDLVVASSVLSFIPDSDLPGTMQTLGALVRPGGVLCHSDWPQADSAPDGFTVARANSVYEMAGLQASSTKCVQMAMYGEEVPVFIGVAVKP